VLRDQISRLGLSCHTEIQKRVLGLNTRQLNHRFRYTNRRLIANQLETLNQFGAFGPKGIGKAAATA
jgi:hypothetical protein